MDSDRSREQHDACLKLFNQLVLTFPTNLTLLLHALSQLFQVPRQVALVHVVYSEVV